MHSLAHFPQREKGVSEAPIKTPRSETSLLASDSALRPIQALANIKSGLSAEHRGTDAICVFFFFTPDNIHEDGSEDSYDVPFCLSNYILAANQISLRLA